MSLLHDPDENQASSYFTDEILARVCEVFEFDHDVIKNLHTLLASRYSDMTCSRTAIRFYTHLFLTMLLKNFRSSITNLEMDVNQDNFWREFKDRHPEILEQVNDDAKFPRGRFKPDLIHVDEKTGEVVLIEVTITTKEDIEVAYAKKKIKGYDLVIVWKPEDVQITVRTDNELFNRIFPEGTQQLVATSFLNGFSKLRNSLGSGIMTEDSVPFVDADLFDPFKDFDFGVKDTKMTDPEIRGLIDEVVDKAGLEWTKQKFPSLKYHVSSIQYSHTKHPSTDLGVIVDSVKDLKDIRLERRLLTGNSGFKMLSDEDAESMIRSFYNDLRNEEFDFIDEETFTVGRVAKEYHSLFNKGYKSDTKDAVFEKQKDIFGNEKMTRKEAQETPIGQATTSGDAERPECISYDHVRGIRDLAQSGYYSRDYLSSEHAKTHLPTVDKLAETIWNEVHDRKYAALTVEAEKRIQFYIKDGPRHVEKRTPEDKVATDESELLSRNKVVIKTRMGKTKVVNKSERKEFAKCYISKIHRKTKTPGERETIVLFEEYCLEASFKFLGDSTGFFVLQFAYTCYPFKIFHDMSFSWFKTNVKGLLVGVKLLYMESRMLHHMSFVTVNLAAFCNMFEQPFHNDLEDGMEINEENFQKWKAARQQLFRSTHLLCSNHTLSSFVYDKKLQGSAGLSSLFSDQIAGKIMNKDTFSLDPDELIKKVNGIVVSNGTRIGYACYEYIANFNKLQLAECEDTITSFTLARDRADGDSKIVRMLRKQGMRLPKEKKNIPRGQFLKEKEEKLKEKIRDQTKTAISDMFALEYPDNQDQAQKLIHEFFGVIASYDKENAQINFEEKME